MKPRTRVLAAAAVLGLVASVAPPQAPAATALRGWCMTYCDAIHVGCEKTLGWLDQDACDEWHSGCLDGCRVND